MKNLYVYIKNEKVEDAIKYGMKLTEFANKIIPLTGTDKRGISAFFSPKDSELYYDETYTCLRITTNNLTIFVSNRVCENTELEASFIKKLAKYHLGDYEDPLAIICSTILPENIFLYNKIQDLPILIENSKEYYYEKSVTDMIENNYFSSYELYQMLLILGEQKKLFHIEQTADKLKLYQDDKTGKIYTKKSSF